MQAGVVVEPLVGVDDAMFGRIADRAAADEVTGHRDVDHVAEGAQRVAALLERRGGLYRRAAGADRPGQAGDELAAQPIGHVREGALRRV